jgi:hypothetical protein
MLVIPFMTRNGSNKHFAKTNRPPVCCLKNFRRGPFFFELAPTRNAPTRIGSGRSTKCGSMSATASRWQPANAFLISILPTNARRPPVINGFSMRRLHVINAFLTKRLLVVLWPNALLLHNGWRPPEPSSYGFATAASTSGSPTRLCGDNNARPLLHVCDMSRTAAHAWCSQRSSIDRQLQCEQRLWQTRPPQGSHTRESIGQRGQQAMTPRVGRTRCGIGGVSICHRTMLLFVRGAVEDGSKFGRRKGVGGVGGVCSIMGCNVGANGIDHGATLP